MELTTADIQDKRCALKYVDSIDLSNACRAYYKTRLESTRKLKDLWPDMGDLGGLHTTHNNARESGWRKFGEEGRRSPKASLNSAISTLRREIAVLMDQDLYLMKQLLTLNEEIEDLKWRKLHTWSRTSSFCSSDMIQSAVSLGRVDEHSMLEFQTPSSLSLQLEDPGAHFAVYYDDDPSGTFNRACSKSRPVKLKNNSSEIITDTTKSKEHGSFSRDDNIILYGDACNHDCNYHKMRTNLKDEDCYKLNTCIARKDNKNKLNIHHTNNNIENREGKVNNYKNCLGNHAQEYDVKNLTVSPFENEFLPSFSKRREQQYSKTIIASDERVPQGSWNIAEHDSESLITRNNAESSVNSDHTLHKQTSHEAIPSCEINLNNEPSKKSSALISFKIVNFSEVEGPTKSNDSGIHDCSCD